MVIIEDVLRRGRRGLRFRPFSRAASLKPISYSRFLQRALTDFGAEESFARAADRVREHYGIEISPSTIRNCTLQHGRCIVKAADKVQLPPAKDLVTQIDGSLIPVVATEATAEDKRKSKKLFWREVRLCSARPKGKARSLYRATLGSLEATACMWQETAQRAGLTDRTHVHGVGDGAPWIVEKFRENFPEGRFLLDFYHLSEYLAQAAVPICGEKKAQPWLRRQQSRLLQNQWPKVLRALEAHLKQSDQLTEDSPVRIAHRYLFQRREHLDYTSALKQGNPIGSGEIESGHRHVVQQRLKLPGAWWTEINAERMLNLRTARANAEWEHYWN